MQFRACSWPIVTQFQHRHSIYLPMPSSIQRSPFVLKQTPTLFGRFWPVSLQESTERERKGLAVYPPHSSGPTPVEAWLVKDNRLYANAWSLQCSIIIAVGRSRLSFVRLKFRAELNHARYCSSRQESSVVSLHLVFAFILG